MKFGKFIKRGGHSVGHLFKGAGNKLEGAVHDVYSDYTGAVSFVGKNLVKDVGKVTSAVTSPLLWIVVGGVVLVFLMNKN